MPSRKILRRAARQVDHEIAMLLETATRLREPGRSLDPVLRGALTDSWIQHYRAVLGFFQPRKDDTGDAILAAHYIRNGARWSRMQPRLSPRERRRQAAARRALGPLTYRRRPRTRLWNEADHDALERRIRLFLRYLTTARRRWFPRTNRKLSDQMELL